MTPGNENQNENDGGFGKNHQKTAVIFVHFFFDIKFVCGKIFQEHFRSLRKGEKHMLMIFFLLWVIFNGSLTPEIAVFGAAVSVSVFAFTCAFMGYSFKGAFVLQKAFSLFQICNTACEGDRQGEFRGNTHDSYPERGDPARTGGFPYGP